MPDTFSLPQLRGDLERLCGLLAELLEIDLVLDGLEARGLTAPLGPKAAMTLGVTEPFTVLYRASGPAPTPFSGEPMRLGKDTVDLGFIADARSQATVFRAAVQASLEPMVEPLVRVRSEELRAAAGVLVTLYLDLHGVMQDDFAGLRNEGADWEGAAADAFFDGVYEPLAQIRANHLWAIDYLISLTAHLKAVNDLGQHSLTNLVAGALEVALAQLHQRHERSRASSSAEALAFLSAATGVASVIAFPLGVGVGVALGSISYMLGYAASGVPREAGVAVIEASSARELHDSLLTHVRGVVTTVTDGFEQTGARAAEMQRSIDVMDRGGAGVDGGPSRVGVWLPRLPDLVAGHEFHHHSSGRGR